MTDRKAEQTELDERGVAVVEVMLEAFQAAKEPRSRHRREFPLPPLLATGLIAVMAGQAGYEAWERFWDAHADLMPRFGLRRVPRESCWRRLFKRLDPASVRVALDTLVERLAGPLPDEAVAHADGKTLRAARGASGRAPHHLAVVVDSMARALLEHPVSGKTSEPLELAKQIERLKADHPALCVLTGDALFAHRDLAGELDRCDVDYLFKLKKTNPSCTPRPSGSSPTRPRSSKRSTRDTGGSSGAGSA